MKSTGNIVSLFVLIIVSASLGFYLYQRHSDASKVSPATLPRGSETSLDIKVDLAEPHVEIHAETPTTTPTTKVKKGCTCCRDALAEVKAKRKELEMWAREMINTHGYDEGMNRVNAHSPTLAKRVRGLLEKEKKSTNPAYVQP